MHNPHVLISPAMAIGSRFYRPSVEEFRSRGWDATALERRGFGAEQQSASRKFDWSFADEIDDIAGAVNAVKSENPGQPVILLGHSLGAQLGAGHVISQRGANRVDGFVSIGSSLPYWRHYGTKGWGMLAMALSIPATTMAYGYLPRPYFGAPGARSLMRDWARFAVTGRPPFETAHRIEVPALDIHLEGDRYAVAAANDGFVSAFIDPAVLTRWIYRRADVPPGYSNHHIGWVRAPGPVIDRIMRWWEQAQPS